MSRETKIGLIIGLGFIVCFAVLLANSDPERKSAVQWTHVVDGVGGKRFGSRPSREAVPAKRESGLREPIASTAPRRQALPAPQRLVDQPLSLPLRRSVSAEDHRSAVPSNPSRDRFAEPVVPSSRATVSAEALLRRQTQDEGRLREYLDVRKSLQSPSDLEGKPIAQVAVRHDMPPAREFAQPLRENRSSSRLDRPQRAPTRSGLSVRHGARNPRFHKVAAGDTLTRIAGTYYGTRSRKVVNAIFDANRAILTDADHLSLGMRIALPRIEGFASSASRSGDTGGVPPAKRSEMSQTRSVRRSHPSTAKKTSLRWYQIQKNDRYVSIARTQLGDASRWREIHELNKDRFPDPGQIQWGVRIRLPAVHRVSARNH